MFALASINLINLRPKIDEDLKHQLRRLYGDHKVVDYKTTRIILYNQVDCQNNKITLLYGNNTSPWKCGSTKIPSVAQVNAEHIVPQSFFDKKNPMLTDLHHLYSAPPKLNSKRSNNKFKQMDYSECFEFCRENKCTSKRPSDPDNYSCISKDKKNWMPIKSDRGTVARAILYFMTMYDDVPMSKLGDVNTFKQWNRDFPPTAFDIERNQRVNATQGNANPYILDYTLVDRVF